MSEIENRKKRIVGKLLKLQAGGVHAPCREQAEVQLQLLKLEQPKTDFVPSIERIFELAQRAHSLYLTRKADERAQLLKKVVLNCETDGVSLYPTYRKPPST